MSWVKGRHNWKFGVVYRRQGFNATYNSNAAPNFGFTNALTSAGNLANGNPIDPNSGSGAASFFLGAATGERWRRSKRRDARPRLGLLRPG